MIDRLLQPDNEAAVEAESSLGMIDRLAGGSRGHFKILGFMEGKVLHGANEPKSSGSDKLFRICLFDLAVQRKK